MSLTSLCLHPKQTLPSDSPGCKFGDLLQQGKKVPEDQRKTKLNKQQCAFADPREEREKDTKGEDSVTPLQKHSGPLGIFLGGSETFP